MVVYCKVAGGRRLLAVIAVGKNLIYEFLLSSFIFSVCCWNQRDVYSYDAAMSEPAEGRAG